MTNDKPEAKQIDLIGRCFHVFGENRKISRQGIIRGTLGDGYYLIQYFEFLMGEPSTMEVVHIRSMIRPALDSQEEGSWQFYEDVDHMKWWFKNHPQNR